MENLKALHTSESDSLRSARDILEKMMKGNEKNMSHGSRQVRSNLTDEPKSTNTKPDARKKKYNSMSDDKYKKSAMEKNFREGLKRSGGKESASIGSDVRRGPRTLKRSVSRNDLSSYEASSNSLNKEKNDDFCGRNRRRKDKISLLSSKHKSFSQNDLNELSVIDKFNKLDIRTKNDDISTKQMDKVQKSLSSLSLNRDKKRPPLFRDNVNFSIDHVRFLTTLDDPTYIVKTLIKNETKFDAVINSKLSSTRTLTILSMLNKIYDINLNEIKSSILKKTLTVSFCENIETCITDLFTSKEFKNPKIQSKFVENVSNIVNYFEKTLYYITNYDIFVHLKKLYFSMFEYLSQMKESPEGLLERMVHLLDKIEEREDVINNKIVDETYLNLSVYPTSRDLIENDNSLEGNIVQGAYRDPEHYLGVHFKLLKEDFLDGLRHGIQQFCQELKGSPKKINHDVFVYRDVVCTEIKIDHTNSRKKILHCIELDKKPLRHTDWQTTKRFIHGSLLVLSNDAFSTYCLAILEDRKFSAEGYKILVSLIDASSKIKKFSYYDLVESRVFFEPYFQVLKTLKSIAPTEFPMKKYILYAETVPSSPAYLTPSTAYNIGEHNIILSNSLSWPQCEKLKLNDSQMKALQAALTHELTIIQGPPGTGKTYLGLRLMEILIENKRAWQGVGHAPIFVVCYRNQALDQMLEHLIEKNVKVVRLGGQTKSESVERRTVRNVVQSSRCRHSQSSGQIVSELKSQIEESKFSIHRLASTLDLIRNKEGILTFKMLSPILTEKEIKYFEENNFKEWLNIENATIFAENIDEKYVEETLLCEEDIGFHTSSYPNFHSLEDSYNDPSFIISLTQLRYEIGSVEESILELNQLDQHDVSFESQMQYMHLVYKYHQKKIMYNRLENILNNLENFNTNVAIENLRMTDLDKLNSTNRWILYKLWLKNLGQKYEEQLNSLVEIHNLKIRSLTEFYEMEDAEALLTADIDVVGATTTGAARLSKMLKTLRPKIVIIEEAAEVLEAHIITALTQHCQHLIMIGDHQQLRPSPASHRAVVNHRLDVSLFERMILNGMTCYSLEEQHRMRPSIASLITPIFYQTLHNHESVADYPHVLGVDVDLFFVSHTFPEDKLKDTDSHRNAFESSFTLSLANYLMMQGYLKQDITILTMYGAQLQYMKQEAKSFDNLKGVEIQVVDNYQGEENKVILLSLVRSGANTVGFLAKKNRVCVALSRAQHGLYIVGNMATLAGCSDIWRQIRGQLDTQQAVGDSLPLVCKAHNTITLVSNEADFAPLTNGGCHLPCALEMDCGHTCQYICHNTDLDHTHKYQCNQSCLKLKECGQHPCSEGCGVTCSPCKEIVAHKLPCGHILKAPCSDPPSQDSLCTEEVTIQLKCGHCLSVTCGSEEPQQCTVHCEDSLECGHPCEQLCHLDTPSHEGVKCTRRCERPNSGCSQVPPHLCSGQCSEECPTECTEQVELTLDCGHTLSLLCSAAAVQEDRPPCPDVSLRSLPCGHELLARCSQSLEEIICEKFKQVELLCGHMIEVACNTKETDGEIRCEAPVPKGLLCGHPAEVPCWSKDSPEEELEVECNVMVETELSCGHTLSALCSQSQQLSSELCAEKVDRQLPCGHVLEGALCGQPIELLECHEQVERFIEECGHTTMMECREAPVSANCSAPCTQVRADCGHDCSGQCKEPCQKVDCSKPVEVAGRCGHQWSLSCADALRQKTNSSPTKCPVECGDMLVCGHICEGSCGQCMQTRIHVPCQAKCGQLLLCGHECEAYCWQELHYCKKLCSNTCEHAKCRNRCGDPCFQCTKSCNWTCEHYSCKQACFEDCERPACSQVCRLKLACGHGCMGFCGEPCPAVCYGCDPAVEWTRYVYLEDCKHSVAEKELLEKGGPLGVLVCTECSLPVLTTRRYRDRIRLIFSSLPEIKSQMLSFHWKQGDLLTDLQMVLRDFMRAPCKLRGCQELSRLLRDLRNRTYKTLQPGCTLRTNNLRSLLFTSLYVQEMSGQLGRLAGQPPKEVSRLVDRALSLVRHLKGRTGRNFSQAELDQYTVELGRLTYLIDLRQMKTNSAKMQAQIDKVHQELDTEERLAAETLARLGEMVGFLKRSSGLFSDDTSPPLSPLNKYRSPTLHGTDWAKCTSGHLYNRLVGSVCQLCAPTTTPPHIL